MKVKEKLSILNISLTSGGAEKVISLLLKKLVEDYEVTLFLFYNEIHFPIPDGVTTIIFNKNPPQKSPAYSKILDALLFTYKYNQQLKKRNIQYAISFLAFPNLVNGIISLFNKKVTTIISERGYPSDNTSSKLSHIISKIFYPLLYNRNHKLFSNSNYINKDLESNFGIKIPMEVIYNPIEVPKNTVVPQSLTREINTLKIINVGTLNTRKNQQMILKAIKQADFDCKFKLLGEGHLENELKELTNEYCIQEKVSFKGKVKDVNKYLLDSDIFVLSSYTEGFPNALLEAMSIGLPCISTNCLSGPLEMLHDGREIHINEGEFFLGSYGILINNNDDKALVSALKYLKNNKDKRVYYNKMSLLKAKEYSLDSIYNQFKKFIQN